MKNLPTSVNVFITFIKIWFTIIIIFSLAFCFMETSQEPHLLALIPIIGLSFAFSIPLAIVLLMTLGFSTFFKSKAHKALFVYFIACCSIPVYCYKLEILSDDHLLMGTMLASVVISLILWTNKIIELNQPLPEPLPNDK